MSFKRKGKTGIFIIYWFAEKPSCLRRVDHFETEKIFGYCPRSLFPTERTVCTVTKTNRI